MNANPTLPVIISGGMGVNVSGWPLVRAVSGHPSGLCMGTVSGTALDTVVGRLLQLGDGDDIGAAFAALGELLPALRPRLDTLWSAYFQPGGKDPTRPFRLLPKPSLKFGGFGLDMLVAANFAAVWLAKRGHDGPVAVNYLRKLQLPLLPALYGAMLAGVDYVAMGAGNPGDIPAVLRAFSRGAAAELTLSVLRERGGSGKHRVLFDPADFAAGGSRELAQPRLLAIVGSDLLATALAGDPATAPDGFIIEGPSAGGHNAPPRRPLPPGEDGLQWGEADEVDLAAVAALGLPFWLAGGYGTPDGLRAALAAGAAGVQVGSAFALSRESGQDDGLRAETLGRVAAGTLGVRSEKDASPSGFPFKVGQLPGTLSDAEVAEGRPELCDISQLVSLIEDTADDGTVTVRRACPAEPRQQYLDKGGSPLKAGKGLCVCNGLFATVGLGQTRRDGYREPPLVTIGSDTESLEALVAALGVDFGASDVVDWLLTGRS